MTMSNHNCCDQRENTMEEPTSNLNVRNFNIILNMEIPLQGYEYKKTCTALSIVLPINMSFTLLILPLNYVTDFGNNGYINVSWCDIKTNTSIYIAYM